MKQYAKTFPVELFKRGILVFFGTQEQLRRYIEKHYPCYLEEIDAALDDLPPGSAFTFKVKDDAIIYAETIPCEGVMVHEIVHATKHLLSLVDVEDEETLCYTVEYLYERIIGWLRSISSSASGDAPSA